MSFIQDLMGRVVSEQPDDPYAFLVHVLERKASRMVSVCFRAHLYICYFFHTFRKFIPDEKCIFINCIILFFRDTNLVGLEEAPGTSVSAVNMFLNFVLLATISSRLEQNDQMSKLTKINILLFCSR